MHYTARPITPEARNRMTGRGTEHSPFRSTWTATEQLLDLELRQLRARDVILMVDVTEADLRLDGKIRAGANPSSPACALTFNSPSKGPLLFCCGRYRTWQDNARAIALGLQALRKIERYGIVQSDEQYRGWRAIGTGSDEWAHTLSHHSGWSVEHVHADPDGAYRAAAKNAHPDQGGTPEAFREVQKARRRAG